MHKMIDGIVVPLTPQELAEKLALDAAWEAGETLRLAEHNRKKRNDLLSETDWVATKAIDQSAQDGLSVQIPVVWLEYRQNLRDITTHVNWPNLTNEDWPTKP